MFDSDTPRLSRLTAILVLLQSHKLVTATSIANKFNISTRTAYRDIKALEDAGVPIVTEEGRGYSLMEDYTLPPIMFTEAEANALITAEMIISANKDLSLANNYSQAVAKIKAILKHSTKGKTELLAERIYIRNNPNREITSNYLMLLQMAITDLSLIKISYSDEQHNSTDRRVEPLALYSTQENWILIAFCRLRQADRAFRLDRIASLEILPEKFESHNFSFQKYAEQCSEKNNKYP
ncbi:MAG: hypothetical protein RL662_877 [Bacteroidota bacterium]|jgi:predicted DNA-binding transcriptional regulator YafY